MILQRIHYWKIVGIYAVSYDEMKPFYRSLHNKMFDENNNNNDSSQ